MGAFMPSLRSLIAVLPLALLAACATTGKSPGAAPAVAAAPAADTSGASAYGLFLAGRAAMNEGRSDEAARYYSRAARADAEGGFLNDRAFSAALLSGDIKSAAQLAPAGGDADAAVARIGALVRAVELMAQNKGKAARALLTGGEIGYPHKAAAALLAPWAAAMTGDVAASTARPSVGADPIPTFFANLGQARLFERAGRFDEAETGYKALIGGGDPGGMATVGLGAMMQRRGRWDEAVDLYNEALRRMPGDAGMAARRAEAQAHKAPPPLPPVRQAAAEALMGPAAALIMQKQQEVALAYLRLALRLDPTRDEAWVLVGDILASANDLEAAREAYMKAKPGSDQYVQARAKLAWSYQGAGEKEAALKVARDTALTAPNNRDAAVTLADILRAQEQYDESARVLDGVIAAQGDSPDWRLLYMRAVAHQQADQWDAAEKDLQAALKIKPEEPELLNFLGYSWIDRGERLDEALEMAKKAVAQNPQSGAMLDTLGWGYYRKGDFKKAVEQLEAAVVLEPSDPDVNNHLGDAYWRVGRTIEAQYQWRRVLTLQPTTKLKTEVEGKLKSGLATPPARVAGS
jgi:tetratricopeptide (TPR) repeat protein